MNTQYNKEVVALFNQAAQVAVTNSLAVLEQQVTYLRENADRNLSRAMSMQQLQSVEDVLGFHKSAGEAEMTELKKAGEGLYQIADSTGKEFITVAKKARELAETSFIEAGEKTASVLPHSADGKNTLFSDMLRSSVKTATDLFQNSFDAAVNLARTGAASVREQHETVSAQLAQQAQVNDSSKQPSKAAAKK